MLPSCPLTSRDAEIGHYIRRRLLRICVCVCLKVFHDSFLCLKYASRTSIPSYCRSHFYAILPGTVLPIQASSLLGWSLYLVLTMVLVRFCQCYWATTSSTSSIGECNALDAGSCKSAFGSTFCTWSSWTFLLFYFVFQPNATWSTLDATQPTMLLQLHHHGHGTVEHSCRCCFCFCVGRL